MHTELQFQKKRPWQCETQLIYLLCKPSIKGMENSIATSSHELSIAECIFKITY